MESAVERISRYLDRRTVPLFSTDVRWLLLSALCRLLRRYAKKVERLELVGDISALPGSALDDGWAERANSHADLTKIFRRLGPRSCTIFSLRLAGFTWREIADALKLNELAVRRSFWREIRRVQNNLPHKPDTEKPRHGPEPQWTMSFVSGKVGWGGFNVNRVQPSTRLMRWNVSLFEYLMTCSIVIIQIQSESGVRVPMFFTNLQFLQKSLPANLRFGTWPGALLASMSWNNCGWEQRRIRQTALISPALVFKQNSFYLVDQRRFPLHAATAGAIPLGNKIRHKNKCLPEKRDSKKFFFATFSLFAAIL
jgi:hypothetical protein